MKKIITMFAVVVLSACSSIPNHEKTDDFRGTENLCRYISAEKVPIKMKKEGDKTIVKDENVNLRSEVFLECMKSKGYELRTIDG